MKQARSVVGALAIAATAWAAPAAAQQSNVAAQQNKTPDQKPAFAQTAAKSVSLSDLEENPATYRGQVVKVSGEIGRVLGPRMFTIDEPAWVDFDGETIVLLPAALAAMVKENDAVAVTGTVRPLTLAEVRREWGVFDLGNDVEIDLSKRPAIVANRVIADAGNMALAIDVMRASGSQNAKPTGTSGADKTGAERSSPITDPATLAKADDTAIVGRSVQLKGVRVSSLAKDGGFWVESGQDRFFVLPADKTDIKAGQNVEIKGVVLEMPDAARNRIGGRGVSQEEISVFAGHVAAV